MRHHSFQITLVTTNYLPSISLSNAWWFILVDLITYHPQLLFAEWTAIAHWAQFMSTRASTFEQNLHTTHPSVYHWRQTMFISLSQESSMTFFTLPSHFADVLPCTSSIFSRFFYIISYFKSRFVSFNLALNFCSFCFKVITVPSCWTQLKRNLRFYSGHYSAMLLLFFLDLKSW